MTLRIPPEHYGTIGKLLSLSPEAREKLLDELKKTPPKLFLRELVPRLAERTGINAQEVFEILAFLSHMHRAWAESELEISEFADEFIRALKVVQDPAISPKAYEQAEFPEQIKAFLSLKSLALTAKASRVRIQHQNVFRHSQVLTDFRPIFELNPSDPPAAGTTVHTLKIQFMSNYSEREIFFALDIVDLRHLRKVIERAIKKEASLKAIVEKAGLPYLEPE